jgi:flagellar basal-body rod modification protein FlgD
MDVTPLTTPSSNSPSTPQPSKLGKDDFLKLLMTQLGNQDPLSPMDNQAFVTQLAQFSQVELAQVSSQQLDALLMAQASANQIQATSLVGKEVAMKHSGVDWSDTQGSVTVSGTLASDASQVTAVVRDDEGNVVRRVELGERSAGALDFSWDGRTNTGALAPSGHYEVAFTAVDASGNAVDAQAVDRARVTGVSFETGYAELILSNQQRVKLADVLRVTEAG